MAKKRGFKINLLNRWFYTFTAIGILAIISFGVYALMTSTGGGHPSTEIIVSFGTCNVTLQEAINKGYLNGTATSTSCLSTLPSVYHAADKILITINGYTMTLQEAVNNNVFITGATRSYSTTLPVGGHNASEVEITVGGVKKSLQDAVSQLKCVPKTCVNLGYNCGSWDNGCLGTLNCGTCTSGVCSNGVCCVPKTCVSLGYNCGSWPDDCGGTLNCGSCPSDYVCNFDGKCTYFKTGWNCYPEGYDSVCINPGRYLADGTCSGWLYKSRGTDCYRSPWTGDYTKACDGNGKCLGWSGSGDNSYVDCPFGYYDEKKQLDYDGTKCRAYVYYCNLNGNQGKYYKPYYILKSYQTCTGRECTTTYYWEDNSYWTEWSYTGDPIADIAVCSDCVLGLYCREYKGTLEGWSPSWKIKPY